MDLRLVVSFLEGFRAMSGGCKDVSLMHGFSDELVDLGLWEASGLSAVN